MIDRVTKADDRRARHRLGHAVVRFACIRRFGVQLAAAVSDDPAAYYTNVLRPAVDTQAEGPLRDHRWHHIDDTTKHVDTRMPSGRHGAALRNDDHVLFELFNEPINGGSWTTVRADMQSFYNTVRLGAPDNLVLVGTPNWCQVLAPTATQPIEGTNVVYVAHMYPQHWDNPTLRNHIVTAAAVHPVFLTEWGFQSPSNMILDGTISSYGTPFKQFVEEHKLSWTAWCASSNWGPPLFNSDYSLRVGEGEMGGFAKDWLYEKRDSDLPAE